jgi:hypothetical protein
MYLYIGILAKLSVSDCLVWLKRRRAVSRVIAAPLCETMLRWRGEGRETAKDQNSERIESWSGNSL